MTWDLSAAPELRESLIDLLADALVAYAERPEAELTGVTPTGLNRRAENPNADGHLERRHSDEAVLGATVAPALGDSTGEREISPLGGHSAALAARLLEVQRQ